jgi:hypothetical protein
LIRRLEYEDVAPDSLFFPSYDCKPKNGKFISNMVRNKTPSSINQNEYKETFTGPIIKRSVPVLNVVNQKNPTVY